MAAIIEQDAVGATTAASMVRILHDARASSAAYRYGDAASRLARGERIRLDALAPSPLATVLAAAGIADLSVPFLEALRVASSNGDELTSARMIETAGIPVLWTLPEAVLDQLRSVSRARTPMALIHVAASANELGRPDAEIAHLAEAFLTSVERYGQLFVTLLRWTHHHFLRDAAWRAAPFDFALAAIWVHAERVLDIVIGGGLAPEPLRRSIEGFHRLRESTCSAYSLRDPTWHGPAGSRPQR